MATEDQVRDAFLRGLKELLPSLRGGRVRTRPFRQGGLQASGVDLALDVQVGSRKWTILREVKSVGEPRYLHQAIAALEPLRRTLRNTHPIVIAPYISPEGQRLCREANRGYVDLAGNAFLQFDGVLIERAGRQVPPEARTRIRRLFSPRSTRVLRVYLENFAAKWTFARVAAEARVSLRTAYLVVNTLADKGYAEKRRGSINLTRPGDLLNLWTENYTWDPNPRPAYYTFIRAPGESMARIAGAAARQGIEYALPCTARLPSSPRSSASPMYTSTCPAVPSLWSRAWTFGRWSRAGTPTSFGHTTWALCTAREIRGVRVVGNVQLYLDLVNYSARGKEQAEELRKKV